MAWTSGTAAGHDALLTALKTFLTTNASLVAAGQNWVAEKDETFTPRSIYNLDSGDLTGNMRGLYLRGPGLGGLDNIHVNILRYQWTGNYQNWCVTGATGFDTNQAWENQPGIMAYSGIQLPFFVLTSADIDYWIIANGRRFILICEIGGDFHVMYGGLILPYAKPSEFPYPMFIGVSSNDDEATPASNMNNFYTHLGSTTSLFREPGGDIMYCSNLSGTNQIQTWPFYESTFYLDITNNPDGSFTLLPMIFFTDEKGGNIYGEPEGCFFVSHFGTTNLLNQDIIQIGGVDHLVCQDMDDSSQNHWAAFRLE